MITLKRIQNIFCKEGGQWLIIILWFFCLNLEMVLSSMSQYDNVTISNSRVIVRAIKRSLSLSLSFFSFLVRCSGFAYASWSKTKEWMKKRDCKKRHMWGKRLGRKEGQMFFFGGAGLSIRIIKLNNNYILCILLYR